MKSQTGLRALGFVLAAFGFAVVGWGLPGAANAAEDPASTPQFAAPPVSPTLQSVEDHPRWSEGLTLEEGEALAASVLIYEQIAADVPTDSQIYWRIARNYWRIGEDLPTEAKEERLKYFDLAQSWAERGLEVDEECSECMLWKFSSIGRAATTDGILGAMSTAGELADLLDRALELKSDHVDNPDNSTMGNMYYAAASFYRIVPDWWWLKWVIGVRGDKERSLEYIREAVEIGNRRIDYRLELGAILTCLGVVDEDKKRLAEGKKVLGYVTEMDHVFATDPIDQGHAVTLLQEPKLACGFSRDGFIDISSPDAEVSYGDFNRHMEENDGKVEGSALPSVSAGSEKSRTEPDGSER